MMKIKLFEEFILEAQNYKKHKLANYVLTKEDALKILDFEIDDEGPGASSRNEEDDDKFIKEIEGKTLAEFSEWRWPDEPQKQFTLTLKILGKK